MNISHGKHLEFANWKIAIDFSWVNHRTFHGGHSSISVSATGRRKNKSLSHNYGKSPFLMGKSTLNGKYM